MNKLLQLIAANGSAAIQARISQPTTNGGNSPRSLLVRNASTPSETKLYIYDIITPYADVYYGGVSAKMVIDALAQIEDPANTTLHVHFNSPGGDVFEGRAIRTILKAYAGPVLGHIDALAASAATTVADGCDSCDIAQGAMYMIHNSWTLAYGDKQDLLKTADLLDKIDTNIAADYQQRTGATLAQVVDWMNAETWFNADEAVAQKFCSAVVATGSSKSSGQGTSNRVMAWDLSAYDHAPDIAAFHSDVVDDADKDALQWSDHVQRRMSLIDRALRIPS